MGNDSKLITPNYERMRSSYCYAVQTAWVKYCEAYKKWLDSIWFNELGEMCVFYTEKYREETDKAAEAFHKAKQDLMDFDAWARVEKRAKGVMENGQN